MTIEIKDGIQEVVLNNNLDNDNYVELWVKYQPEDKETSEVDYESITCACVSIDELYAAVVALKEQRKLRLETDKLR